MYLLDTSMVKIKKIVHVAYKDIHIDHWRDLILPFPLMECDWSAELDIKMPCEGNFRKQTSNEVL